MINMNTIDENTELDEDSVKYEPVDEVLRIFENSGLTKPWHYASNTTYGAWTKMENHITCNLNLIIFRYKEMGAPEKKTARNTIMLLCDELGRL